MSRNMSGGNIDIRKESAKIRADERKNLTIAQRIELLDSRLGKGVGAKKERVRLGDKATAALNDTSNASKKKNMPQEGLTQEKSPKKYARKYSGKEKN